MRLLLIMCSVVQLVNAMNGFHPIFSAAGALMAGLASIYFSVREAIRDEKEAARK